MARIYRLQFSCILHNLAVEERLLQEAVPGSFILYRSNPCVVLGRNQNPWKECNIRYLRREGIELARRRSGGGTVFHDRGNLCFSFINTAKGQDRHKNSSMVAEALNTRLGIPTQVNERSDVLVDGKKISGSAFRITKDRAYHHGTVLVRSDLGMLDKCIKSPELDKISSRATNSVRSTVSNLTVHRSDLDVEDVARAVEAHVRELQQISAASVSVGMDDFTEKDRTEVEKLKQKSWLFGETPAFSIPYEMHFTWGSVRADINVARGGQIGIAKFSGPSIVSTMPSLGRVLADVEFGGTSISQKILAVAAAVTSDKRFLIDIAEFFSDAVPDPFSSPSRTLRAPNQPGHQEWDDPIEI